MFARQFVHSMFEQITDGEHRLETSVFRHNRQVPDVPLHHVNECILFRGLLGDRLGRGGHHIPNQGQFGVALPENYAQHNITFSKNAPQHSVVHNAHRAHTPLGHHFHGFQHGCARLHQRWRNLRYLEKTDFYLLGVGASLPKSTF
jgi:hypothetical protein